MTGRYGNFEKRPQNIALCTDSATGGAVPALSGLRLSSAEDLEMMCGHNGMETGKLRPPSVPRLWSRRVCYAV